MPPGPGDPVDLGTGLVMAWSNQGHQFTGALTTSFPRLDSCEAIYDLAPLETPMISEGCSHSVRQRGVVPCSGIHRT